METVNDIIFQIQSPEVVNYYQNQENIKIIEDKSTQSGICVIYFSSNELYYPNTIAAFTTSIIKKDKFEWQNNRFPNAQLHIFVRDIQKQWYVEGVSAKYNTIPLVAQYLKVLSNGYKVYTMGSSAGGFAAILFGSLINCERVYAFNAQFNLDIIIKNSKPNTDPLLFKYKTEKNYAQYFSVSDFLKPTINYFYFQSANSEMDIVQFNACVNKKYVHKIEFATSNHGFPFLRHNLPFVLSMTVSQLIAQSKKAKIHPFLFSVKIDGFYKAFTFSINAILKRVKKKMYDEKRG